MIYCYSDVPINILNVLWYGTICGMGQSENLSCMLVLVRPVAVMSPHEAQIINRDDLLL